MTSVGQAISQPLPFKTKSRTETVSFRIDRNLRVTLEQEAKKLGISLNTLVSQIFTRYSGWDRFAGRLKLIPVSKDLLRDLFGPMEKEKIRETAKGLAETSGREHILYLFQELTFASVLQFVEIWSSHFDAYEHRYDGKRHFYTVHHDVNLNFSLFVKEYISTLIEGTIPRPVKFEAASPNAVTFSFEG